MELLRVWLAIGDVVRTIVDAGVGVELEQGGLPLVLCSHGLADQGRGGGGSQY